jgi:hypothetical protein
MCQVATFSALHSSSHFLCTPFVFHPPLPFFPSWSEKGKKKLTPWGVWSVDMSYGKRVKIVRYRLPNNRKFGISDTHTQMWRTHGDSPVNQYRSTVHVSAIYYTNLGARTQFTTPGNFFSSFAIFFSHPTSFSHGLTVFNCLGVAK